MNSVNYQEILMDKDQIKDLVEETKAEVKEAIDSI
jgi:hypothetical protein